MIIMKKHTFGLLSYLVLVFLISWGGVYAIGYQEAFDDHIFNNKSILLHGIFMLAGPFFAGLTVTYLYYGKSRINELFKNMLSKKIERKYFILAFLFPILILMILYILGYTIDAGFLPVFLISGFFIGMLAGFFEEFGWMGVAYPSLRKSKGYVYSSIFLGLIHFIWHIYPDYVHNKMEMNDFWLKYIIGFGIFIIALRIIITWTHEKTDHLGLCQLIHAGSTASLLIFLPLDLCPENKMIFYLIYGVVLLAMSLLIVLLYPIHPKGRLQL